MRQHADALPGVVVLPDRDAVEWPEERRLAVAVTFDLYGSEAASTLQIIGSSLDFGVRRGVWRVLDSLERLSIPATFNIPAVTAMRYPEVVQRIVQDGHEVAALGYDNRAVWSLDESSTRTQIRAAVSAIEEVAGVRPLGWRTPHLRPSRRTLGLLPQEGFIWDSTLRNDDTPYVLQYDEGTIVEIPVRGPNDDSRYFGLPGPTMGTHEAFQIWRDEADGLIAEAQEQSTMFSTTFRPFHIGRPAQLAAFEDLFADLMERSDTWFATCSQIAKWWTRHANWVTSKA